MARPSITPPTSLSRTFVRYLTGFGVGVGLGTLPWLGKVHIPGFDALLSLYPFDMQNTLIPFAAFLMGLIALATQFFAAERVAPRALRRSFKWGLLGILGGLLVLAILYVVFVRRVPLGGGEKAAAVVAFGSRLPHCQCQSDDDDVQCLKQLTLDPPSIATCWGGAKIQLAEIVLSVLYLGVMGGFGSLVGLLLLQEEDRRRRLSAAAPTSSSQARRRPDHGASR